ncbi:MAG TPA: 6-phospho-beta-glucosidase [Streptosporangiaceae bacterium]
MTKLAILGGGGFRVPLVHRALLRASGALAGIDVVLFDPDPGRLAVIETVLAQQAADVRSSAGRSTGPAPKVSSTTDLSVALDGADFVFSAIRVGGLAGRINDERVALRHDVLGQETTGPGGIAYGLRTIPVAMRIAEEAARLCPEAWVINFTNPAGMITEAMRSVLGDRVIGICDTPGGLCRRAAAALGIPADAVRPDYVGLNHLGWLRGLSYQGRNVLPDLLADDQALAGLEETLMFGASWLRTLGCVPNEYLFYYYFNREAISSIRAMEGTRGEFLAQQQAEFYAAAAAAPDRALALWRETSDDRRARYMAEARPPGTAHDAGGSGDGNENGHENSHDEEAAGYEGVALNVMTAIAGGQEKVIILNVPGRGALSGLDDNAVVELPCTVNAAGAHPLATAPPQPSQLGLMQQVKAAERFTIEAATTGSRDAALKAFALHPLVDSVSVARELVNGYIAAIPEIAHVLDAGASAGAAW